MFNLKSAFALAIISALSLNASANVLVDEIVIDTSDLQASITADLTAAMNKMHQEVLQEATLLIAADDVASNQQVVKSNSL
ncbi:MULTISPECIES: hypothetical protein [Shewanella]|uniref:hypothetical protein n=1 Tax=Shewanella TaxID=22 RepID=UPI0021675919|nr:MULTISPECIES: hypothetical protein [Shewanella]MCS6115053.1 hypothetical protein [Shewanella baltica]MDT3305773.1 hypothetical protein [Shewanella sp. SP1S1-4]UVW63255.1 hypothetical protein HHE93_06505 [Shewanella baltica]